MLRMNSVKDLLFKLVISSGCEKFFPLMIVVGVKLDHYGSTSKLDYACQDVM